MAADREEAEPVIGGELAEADSAVEGLVGTVGDVAVGEDGEGVDEGLVEASVVEVEQLLELALECVGGACRRLGGAAAGAAAALFACEEADEEVEQAGDEEDDGYNDDDEEDGRADPAAAGGCRERGRVSPELGLREKAPIFRYDLGEKQSGSNGFSGTEKH